MRIGALVISLSFIASSVEAHEPRPRAGQAGPSGLVDLSRAHIPLGGAAVLTLPGSVDLVLQHVSEQALGLVDAPEAVLPGDTSGWTRLRVSPAFTLMTPELGAIAVWRLAAEIDLLRDFWPVGSGRGAVAVDPRGRAEAGLLGQRLSELYLAAAGTHVAVQLGLVRSRWGLGLVSNGGDDPVAASTESPFGTAYQGDHVVRLGVSAFPLGGGLGAPPLTASVAFDGVIDDDTARWSAGDRAYQLVAAVRGATGPVGLGLYVAHRFQDHAEGGSTEVTVIDVTARLEIAKEEGLLALIEGELATIRGRSSLAQSVWHEGSSDVDQLGGILRFSVRSGVFLGVLEVGAASGDTNPFDDEQRAFAMDRDHRVGMMMFRESVLAAQAATIDNLSNPDYRGEAPRGVRRLATQGAVKGAVYANPRMSFRVLGEDGGTADPRLDVYAGFLYGSTDGDLVDAYWSGLAGGAARGFRNGAPSSELGWEVDVGAALQVPGEDVRWRFRLEGAWFQPGRAFADAAGQAMPGVWGISGQAGLLW